MRFTALVFAGAFAMAFSQSAMSFLSEPSSVGASSEMASATSAAPVPKASAQMCIEACVPADVRCKALCQNNPPSDNGQAVDTTACIAACGEGDGGKAATDAYATCSQNCIHRNSLSTANTPQSTNFAAEGSSSTSHSSMETASTPQSTNFAAETSASTSDSSMETASTSSDVVSVSASASSESTAYDSSDSSATDTGDSAASISSTSHSHDDSSSSSGLASAAAAAPAAALGLALAVFAL